MTKRNSKQVQSMKVYGMVHPDGLGVQFAFNAVDDADAKSKAFGWNRYHSFTGTGAYTYTELDPSSTEATWIHNEWMR